MTTLWARLGRLFHGENLETADGPAGRPEAAAPRDWRPPEVAFDLEPHVGKLLQREQASSLVRSTAAVRRGLVIGLKGALAVLSGEARSRTEAVAALRVHAERCRAACERGLAVLLDGTAETGHALAWLAWALAIPGRAAITPAVASPEGAELWARDLPAQPESPAPLVVWECRQVPGPAMQLAARSCRVLLLASEEAPADVPAAWRARGGYHVEHASLPGLGEMRHPARLSTTGASVQALLAGAGPSGWWLVRAPSRSARAEAVPGLRVLRAALEAKVIAMVPQEAGSSAMLIPPLFQPAALDPDPELIRQR